jgi:hypothetical protein
MGVGKAPRAELTGPLFRGSHLAGSGSHMTGKWKRIAGLYRYFARHWPELDFGDAAAEAMFEHESTGAPEPPADNGFMVGKKYLDLTVSMWFEDLRRGDLMLWELYEDANFPHWWLNRVFKRKAAALRSLPC